MLFDELSGALKLYSALGTGAFVLFTNLLAQTRPTRVEPALLFSSIRTFGLMTVCSFSLLLKFATFCAWYDPETSQFKFCPFGNAIK